MTLRPNHLFSDSILKHVLPCASCHERKDHGEGLGLRRADPVRLREIFEKYATVNEDGELYMKADVFVRDYLGLHKDEDYNPNAVKLIAGVVDTSKDGLVSFMEFQAFEALLCSPDALYRTAFQMFDTHGNGVVSFQEFSDVIKKTELYQKVPFNLDSDLVKLYFGKEKNKLVSFAEFSQFLHDYHEEHAVQAFKRSDKKEVGFISALDFYNIMVSVKSHLLTPCVKDNLVAVAGGQQVSFPFFVAFNSLLGNMELAKRVFLNATGNDKTADVSREDFIRSAQMMSQITPLEIDILFKLVQLTQQDTRMQFSDLESMTPEQYMKKITSFTLTEVKAVSSPEERGVMIEVLESAYRFTLGAIAGSVGATAVYPIDLVKTRLQNQRSVSFIGELMYKNSWDCLKKVIRHEGFVGLYRGLVPQLVGVAPEKAIKLTMNDFVRDKFTDHKTKKIALSAEMFAGGCAGGSQVVFTNPLEIVKIRLQVAGELASTSQISAVQVLKELGFFGLYKGARACFLRDIPFSAIYFPVYAHSKKKLSDENGYNSPWTLLVAGAIGGVPAASLTTPADVIKTRLQVAARAGQTTYSGVFDAAKKIWKEEGFGAFWKGAPARVLRSSPQFGVTLLTYEVLQRAFYVDFGGMRPEGSELSLSLPEHSTQARATNPDHIGGFKAAIPILSGIESKFGLVLPKFSHRTADHPN